MAALLLQLVAGEAVCRQPSSLPRGQERVRELGVQSRIWQGCNIDEIVTILVVLLCTSYKMLYSGFGPETE